MAQMGFSWSRYSRFATVASCWAFISLISLSASSSAAMLDDEDMVIFAPGGYWSHSVQADVGDKFHFEWVANGSVSFTLIHNESEVIMQENSSYGYMTFEIRDDGLYLWGLPAARYLTSGPISSEEYAMSLTNIDDHPLAIYSSLDVTQSKESWKMNEWNVLTLLVAVWVTLLTVILAVHFLIRKREKGV